MYLSRACFQSGTWYRKVCVMWKWKANRKLAIFSPCFPGKPPKKFSRLWISLIYKANLWILPLFWTTLFELDKLKSLCLLWFASAVIKVIGVGLSRNHRFLLRLVYHQLIQLSFGLELHKKDKKRCIWLKCDVREYSSLVLYQFRK